MNRPRSSVAKSRPRRITILAFAVAVLATGAAAITIGQANTGRVIRITAERYEYSPDKVVLKKGEPVILELTSRDRLHGFHIKGLNVRADVLPGHAARIQVVPDKVGKFPFTCDLFCGSGHPDMGGLIVVTE